MMLKKVFLITMFGTPFEWTQQYINHVQHLEEQGWHWKIFTPHAFESQGNVEIVPMTAEHYNDLVEKKLWVRSNIDITPQGIPNLHITDFYIFSGVVFEDFIKDADFWGITNLDIVYGNLSKFITDKMLEGCEIFSDDVRTINGVFSLFRNAPITNSLFTKIKNWKEIASQQACPGCLGVGRHLLYGSDEYGMTGVLRNSPEIDFLYPAYYPMLSHDRFQQHIPTPQLEIKDDGSLWELFKDMNGPEWEHARPVMGKEIAYFHFQRTKRWPVIA